MLLAEAVGLVIRKDACERKKVMHGNIQQKRKKSKENKGMAIMSIRNEEEDKKKLKGSGDSLTEDDICKGLVIRHRHMLARSPPNYSVWGFAVDILFHFENFSS
ncbi:hypothetical protein Nepgr_004230 [Nepenthes gracilis]|uniref:Uncharacterized protein n=1 Tax=Nepenthes gracilis TaxID=150966 RepID=A0AAD3S198_NEPGR|nr:hypothetical protein Nepgr_004230 [Nepenthes gracilis]